jgi:hypothetical protein
VRVPGGHGVEDVMKMTTGQISPPSGLNALNRQARNQMRVLSSNGS